VQTEVQVEGIMCPNCKEEVPKTLYCLNCGYPLYKISVDADEVEKETSESVSIEDSIPVVEDTIPFVEDSVPVVQETPEIDEGVAVIVDDYQAPVVEDILFEPITEPSPVIELPTPFMIEIPVIEHEQSETLVEDIEVLKTPEIEEEEPVHTIEVSEPTEIIIEVDKPHESVEFIEDSEDEVEVEEDVVMKEEPITEIEYIFEPEPVTKEVLENLSKNVALKIKLVDLLLKGEVKMATFEKLFDNYVARGEMLMNSRNEMLERVRFGLESGERALNEAKIGLEELGIRRSIGDVSEEEYRAKSPGFEWDIGQYRDDVNYKRAEIDYLENPSRLLSHEELEELRKKGEVGFETIDTLVNSGEMNSEMSERIKEILEESQTCLKVRCE
jgi:hypothetical protein